MKEAICTGSLACKSVAFRNRKQSLYIHLWGVIHGKPSGKKKSRDWQCYYHTEYGLLCVVLWFLLNNKQLSGRESEGEDHRVWRVRNRREGVQIGLSLNSANRKKDRWFMLSSVCMNCRDLVMDQVHEAFLWLSCDLIFGPVLVDMSVNVSFSGPRGVHFYLWGGRRNSRTTFLLFYLFSHILTKWDFITQLCLNLYHNLFEITIWPAHVSPHHTNRK